MVVTLVPNLPLIAADLVAGLLHHTGLVLALGVVLVVDLVVSLVVVLALILVI